MAAVNHTSLRSRVRRLYEGTTPSAVGFRYALLAFDVVTILFIIGTSFLHPSEIIETFDLLFGAMILADFSARLLADRHPLRTDALYFTVTALTTTGFGDITLPGTTGRLITVVIMIFGVTLFFNLARALLSPSKVRFPCPTCGLQRHESDAVHCKACGGVLNIPDEGLA